VHPAPCLLTVEAQKQAVAGSASLAIPARRDERGEQPLDAALVGLAGVVRTDVEQSGVEEVAELLQQFVELLVCPRSAVSAGVGGVLKQQMPCRVRRIGFAMTRFGLT
jgi:hypothetical protein